MRSSINYAIHKIEPGTLTAKTVTSSFKGTNEGFVSRDKTFSFMSSVKGTPAYWKQFLLDVLAMVKQLEISTFFLTLSCANLWDELSYIICKLSNIRLSDKELKKFKLLRTL